ncbi:hypothetical protein N7491_000641 [Penicillium cf. griseofulvum]|nr:hypothetical protein N7491_000641 [Penicillium cf. griseofulvum]
MSRRAPPRDYDEQDEFYEMERERERHHRPRRRDRDYEEDEYRRRRSEPPLEDMKRMHIRERPRRDFMEESFAPPRARDNLAIMREREEADMVSPDRSVPLDRDDVYMRPPGSRRRPRPREVDEEDFVFEERERRRGSRRHPREVDENLNFEETERRGDRRHRPDREREAEDDVFIDEERRRDRRHRRERVPEEDLTFEEQLRERGSGRRRRSEPEFEEDEELFVGRERARESRRHRREFEEDDMISEDREMHRRSRRHPERRSEDDLLFEEREKRHRRRRPEGEFEEELLVEERGKSGGRRHHPEREFEQEEMKIRQKERGEPPLRRGWDSELDIRSRERRLEFEEEETYHRPRGRGRAQPPPPQRVEVEEVLVHDRPQERRRGPIDFSNQESEDDDVIIRRKDKGPRPVDRVDEEIVTRERREKRRSVPSEDLERELRGLRREVKEQVPLDEELNMRAQVDSKSRPRDLEEVKEDISIRKTKDKLPSRKPSPSLDSIHVPPIHQDVFTHHRHIDHGYKDARTPRVRSPEPRSRRGSFDDIDIHHRKMRGGRVSEENIVLKHRDSEESLAPEDSISPTSGSGLDFKDPWERASEYTTRRRPKPLEDESELAYSRREVPSMRDMEEDIMIESTRTVDKAPRSTDDWSVVHAPSHEEAIEMTGALGVVEVQPRQAPVDEIEVGRVAQHVTEPEETLNDRWTEITKKLIVREAIERMGFEYEETRTSYYIFSFLKSEDIDELVELSDEIRSARRRRIRDIQRERSSVPDITPHMRPRMGMPPRARVIEKRMRDIRDREWIDSRSATRRRFRKIIIRRLKKALLEQAVPAPFWAVVQLCDLDKLENIVQIAHFSLKIMDILADLSCGLPFKWTVKPSPSQLDAAFPMPTPPPTFSQPQRASPAAIYAARERDGQKCVITGTRKVFQTAPIFPSGLITSRLQDDPSSPTIWRFVDMFWGQSTTQRWRRAVFNNPIQPQSPVNDCSNLICLRRDIRSAWTSGLFALRPAWISEDMTEMEIEFFWQPRPDHGLYDAVDLAKLPQSTKNVSTVDKLVLSVGVRGDPSYRDIESGHRFRMTTDDPIERPLPNFDLLDMQWQFNRLISLSAAATLYDDDEEDDNASVTTQSNQDSNSADEEDVLAWVKSSYSSDSDSPPETDFVEDINASMIGPLPGSDTNLPRTVSQNSSSSESSAGSDSESSSLVDVISGTGHLALKF